MAKTGEPKTQNKEDGNKRKNPPGDKKEPDSKKPNDKGKNTPGDKKEPEDQKSKGKGGGKKKGGKKEEQDYKPGMSYLYDPCPHRVWTPKPGERDKSEPRGAGSPWYEPVRKKEDVDKEEAEKAKKKDDKAKKKREKGQEERNKQKEEEEQKRKEEEDKKKEEEKKKEKRKQEKEKKKKKKENEKRKKQKEEREKEKEKQKKEEEENKEKGKKKEKPKPQASYMYEPCPHRVYTPAPGEQDLGDPKGINSPWYVPVKKKEDTEKEEEEERKKDMKRRKEERKKRQEEKEEREKQEEEEIKKLVEEHERHEKERQEKLQKKREEKARRREEIEMDHEEMGAGVRDSRTDFTQEMLWMMDFISDVDQSERERKGEALKWKKEEVTEQSESYMAKETLIKDFKYFVRTFVAGEWIKAEKKIKMLEKEEKKKRKRLLKNMDSLPREMIEEGKRFETLFKAGTGEKQKGCGEGKPSEMEDLMVNMIMKQLEDMDGPLMKNLN